MSDLCDPGDDRRCSPPHPDQPPYYETALSGFKQDSVLSREYSRSLPLPITKGTGGMVLGQTNAMS